MYTIICVSILCVLLAALAAFYFFKYRTLKSKFHTNPSYECQQLLSDMLAGGTTVHIERIAPEEFFIRRPM